MALVSSSRSCCKVQDHTRATDLAVRVAMLTRRGVFVEIAARDPVHLATRSSVSLSHSNIIIASVFGSVGFVGLVALAILVVRYWMRHRDTSQDIIIERPSQLFQDTQDTSLYQNAPFPAPIQTNPASIPPPTLDTPDRTYIPNHPYALYYSRNSIPPTPPPKTNTYPQTHYPPVASLTMSHPYTQSTQSQRRERVPSADPSTIYESFMSHNSPNPTPELNIEPMEPSPLASTVGGAMSHHGSQFDALLSAALSSDDAPSTMSVSSSAPLRVAERQSQG